MLFYSRRKNSDRQIATLSPPLLLVSVCVLMAAAQTSEVLLNISSFTAHQS